MTNKKKLLIALVILLVLASITMIIINSIGVAKQKFTNNGRLIDIIWFDSSHEETPYCGCGFELDSGSCQKLPDLSASTDYYDDPFADNAPEWCSFFFGPPPCGSCEIKITKRYWEHEEDTDPSIPPGGLPPGYGPAPIGEGFWSISGTWRW